MADNIDSSAQTDLLGGALLGALSLYSDYTSISSAFKNGEKQSVTSAPATWSGTSDMRACLKVPVSYLVGPAAGPSSIIYKNGGILFPFTPSITMDNQANYTAQAVMHSNYPMYFFKNSTVGPINLTAKFSVQNEFEGAVLLGVIHLLRSLTKMQWGNDANAGTPPPVCRLNAFGDYMYNNIPVVVASWKHDVPDGVDYITVGRQGSPISYGHSLVPVLSTISLTLNIVYSRNEVLNYNVSDWVKGNLHGKGYL